MVRHAPEARRVVTEDGLATTVYVLRLDRATHSGRVVALHPVQPLVDWCAQNNVDNALIGGFYIRADGVPLGDLRVGGRPLTSVPFDPPWDRVRSCVHCNGEVLLRPREELPAHPEGDLLQAGPMLVRDRANLITGSADPEGFSAGARQFDSDITVGRHPRAALGISSTDLFGVVCDGRTESETGMTLAELAQTMIDLGATDAVNLDGGGSATLIVGGQLVNVPHEEHGRPIPGGRGISTAIAFIAR